MMRTRGAVGRFGKVEADELPPTSAPETGFSVLLADGNALFRAGVRYLLRDLLSAGAVVDAASPSETLRLLDDGRFELVLVSHFSNVDWSHFLIDLLDRAGKARVVIISGDADPAAVRETIASGAAGYVLADTAPEVMVQAIRLALAGGVYIPLAALGFDARPDAASRIEVCASQDGLQLTSRQREVLALLAEGESNKQIARGLRISPGAVKAHVASLLRIFGARNRTELVTVATDRGALVRQRESGAPGSEV